MWGLEGKVAVVTGASSGSGTVIAKAFAAEGARVVASGRDPKRLDATVKAIGKAGGEAVGVTADLDRVDSAAAIVEGAVSAFGSIDIVVSNAALFLPATLEATGDELIASQLRVNVHTPLALIRAAVPHMGRGGAIVLVTSTTSIVGFSGYSAYTSTKGAGEAMARALAVELAPGGIRVNTVMPGFVRTPMLQPALDANADLEAWLVERTPAGRLGEPEDVASAVLFLASEHSSYVVGASLVVDGGWVAQ